MLSLKYLGNNTVDNKTKEKESCTGHIARLYEAQDTMEHNRAPTFSRLTTIKLTITMKHQYMPWKKLRLQYFQGLQSTYNLTNC